MTINDRIKKLDIILPQAKLPVGSYVATKITGNLLFISGQISIDENGELIKGKVGKDLSVDDGYNAAKRCGLSIISQAKEACDGDLSKIKSCIKLTGFVNSTDDFTEQPKVINGASDIIAKIFSEKGMHTRAAVSTNSLPLGVAVEVDVVIDPQPKVVVVRLRGRSLGSSIDDQKLVCRRWRGLASFCRSLFGVLVEVDVDS